MSDLSDAMWRQAVRDLEHARSDLAGAYFEWSAYSAQQAAEKAVKAVLLAAGRSYPQIHGMNRLFDALVGVQLATPADKAGLQEDLSVLDLAYGMSRNPMADVNVAPTDLITADQAKRAILAAERVLDFARLRSFLPEHPPEGAERVILFGSLARGNFDGASDADLMLIGGEGSIDTGIWDAADRDVDIVPWKAEDWDRARAQDHPFVLTILREGIELWRAPGLPPLIA